MGGNSFLALNIVTFRLRKVTRVGDQQSAEQRVSGGGIPDRPRQHDEVLTGKSVDAVGDRHAIE
jgi:hypothetical protein